MGRGEVSEGDVLTWAKQGVMGTTLAHGFEVEVAAGGERMKEHDKL